MRNYTCFIATFSMLMINCNLLLAQYQASEIIRRLDEVGFENIRVYPFGRILTVSYENNLYRNKVTAISEVLDQLSGFVYDTLKVVTLVNDLPVIVTQFKRTGWRQIMEGQTTAHEITRQFDVSYKTDAAWNSLRKTMPVNQHINNVDLVFYPQVSMMNVRFDQIYEVQFNIAPALEVSLWRGMKFTGQVIFPVANDYQYGKEGDMVRAGFVTLAQEFRLPNAIQGRAVIGKFDANRYGADIALTKYLFGGQCYLGANAGYTGAFRYYGNGWYRSELNTLTWFVKSGYYYRPHSLQFDVTAGQYLNGDYGIRGDCTRYWGETAIGFFAMVGGGKFNGGFHFAIPLWPKQYKKSRHFQMRTPWYFDWEYNAGTEFYYGQYYETRPNENRSESWFNPIFIKDELLKN